MSPCKMLYKTFCVNTDIKQLEGTLAGSDFHLKALTHYTA